MRKLASVQVVSVVEAIENADALERARVLGWWVVVRKGEYCPGDKVVYFEIDSLLPERPEFEFLRSSSWRHPIVQPDTGQVISPGGFRIRTVRLRGQISQGICFPLSILPAQAPIGEGADVTEALGVVKYEPPIPANLTGRMRGGFPSFIPKTDEPRVQLLETVLARHRGATLRVTEKLDGTSITAFVREGSYGLCSRNLLLDETDLENTACQIAARLDLGNRLARAQAQFGFDIAIQGELVGPGIQKNRYALRAPALFPFTVYDISSGCWIGYSLAQEILAFCVLSSVPQLGTIKLDHTIDDLVAMAIGESRLNQDALREGIVLRAEDEAFDPEIGRLSFKAVNPEFLLKHGE